MTVPRQTRHYSSIIHSAMLPPQRLAVVPPSRRDFAAVLLPLHLEMTVPSWVHGGPLALPAPPPPGQVNGCGARLHDAHPALISTGAVSTPTPDIPIEGRGNKRVANITCPVATQVMTTMNARLVEVTMMAKRRLPDLLVTLVARQAVPNVAGGGRHHL